MKYTIKPYYDHIIGRQLEIEGDIHDVINAYDSNIRTLYDDELEKLINQLSEYGYAIIGDYAIEIKQGV